MHSNDTSRPLDITVLGATGKTGRRVTRRLAALGHHVRSASRATGFDWDDTSTWPATVAGADAVYISYAPDIAFPGAAEQVATVARLAASAGVRRVVLLSGRGEDGAERAERLIQEAGVAWTVVRASWFDQNFDEGHLLPAVLDGELALPAGTVREPFVDADDLADVAVASLVSDAHHEQIYEVTGPEALSFATVAGELSAATGRSISYVSVTPDEQAAALMATGMEPDEAAALAELFATVLDGRNEPLGDGVQRSLGRPPRGFADYARRVAATGVWTTAAVTR